MPELKIYRKENNMYILDSYQTSDPLEIYTRLTNTLIAKKINCCKWVRSIKRENLYNGYQKITVLQNNGIKEIYIIKD